MTDWYKDYHLEAEDPLECAKCGGLYDARCWSEIADDRRVGIVGHIIVCPNCGALSIGSEAVVLTEKNTELWANRRTLR